MSDPRGSWFRVYARQVRQHPKFRALTLHEIGAWLVLRAECELLDGYPITDRKEAILVLKRHNAQRPAALLDRLLEIHLLDVTEDGGYAIHDRGDHDRPKAPSDEPEETRKRKAAERARKAAEEAAASRGGHEDVTTSHEPPSRPVTRAARARAEQSQQGEAEAEQSQTTDLASLACRYLSDPGKWLSNPEYAAAWDDLERRFGSWVDEELDPAYGELKERGSPVRAWDFKRLVEFRCAERVRAEERQRQETVRQQLADDAEKTRAKANGLSAEERERQSLMRRAVKIWSKGGIRDKVPESIDELRTWLAEHDVPAQATP